MAGHAGLTRATVTVHRKGKTIHQRRWVSTDPRLKQQQVASEQAANHGAHDARTLALKRAAFTAGVAIAGGLMGPHSLRLAGALATGGMTALSHGAASYHTGRNPNAESYGGGVVQFAHAYNQPMPSPSLDHIRRAGGVGGDISNHVAAPTIRPLAGQAAGLGGRDLRQHVGTAVRRGAVSGVRQGWSGMNSHEVGTAGRFGGAAAGATIGYALSRQLFPG